MEHGRTRRCWFWNPAWQRPTGSINSSGHFQSTDTNGYEVHVKDLARFPDTHGCVFRIRGQQTWCSRPTTSQKPAMLFVPRAASCCGYYVFAVLSDTFANCVEQTNTQPGVSKALRVKVNQRGSA